MYVRLAFSVAAHLEPEILVVDEVLAVGDAEFQRKCLGKMQDVASTQGRTILFVSHSMAAIDAMCNRALLLTRGRCAALGETADVLQAYLHDVGRLSEAPLEKRADREGSGDIRFVSASLEQSGRKPVLAFQCGAESILHLVMKNGTSSTFRNLNISLGINNEMGQRIALLDTELIDAPISIVPPGELSVRMIMPRLQLIPGRYRLTMHCSINGDVVDWIRDAIVFDVEAADFYGTGRLPPANQGQFLLDFSLLIDRRVDQDVVLAGSRS
jgi:lipopolysaccharide transport system ATP-binding protein